MPPASIRRQGFLRLLLGLGAFVASLTIPLFVIPYFHQHLAPSVTIPFAVPATYALTGLIEFVIGAYTLTGLIEAVSGVSCLDLARRWDQLPGWLRGVFGTVFYLVASLLMVMIIAWLATRS